MGWRGRGGSPAGPWPGRGPFSHLPPWQRPGWLYGRGACWWFFPQYIQKTVPTGAAPPASGPSTIPVAPPVLPTLTREQETQMLEQQMMALESHLDAIKERLKELGK